MLGGHLERLDGHNSRMNKARPDREPNQAEVLQGISGRDQKEDSERGIHAKDHLFILRLVGLPAPA